MTNETSKSNFKGPAQAFLRVLQAPRYVTAFLALLLLPLNSCVTKAQVDALIWLNNLEALQKDVCPTHPELNDYGFYRKLDSGKLEFISVCNANAPGLFSMTSSDYSNLMKGLVPKPLKIEGSSVIR